MESRNAFVLSASGIVLNRGIAVQKSTLRCALVAAERSASCSSTLLLNASRVFVAGNTSSFYGPRFSPRHAISAQIVQLNSQTVSATTVTKPAVKPDSANFGSGPCKKRPGYTLDALSDTPLGRSHRSELGKKKLQEAIARTKEVLRIPDYYLVGIVPGSDTGAVEMAMWNMLGPRPVDIFYWDAFGAGWYKDAKSELKISELREIKADYGDLPDLSQYNPSHDVIFTFNGTTSGVRVPNLDWISADRTGITICDATSGVFAMEVDWSKLDVTTYSWQKVLGGEGAHGMLILSPKAVERLESYQPSWPVPKLLRLTKKGKIIADLFEGSVINTPSMLAVEDYLDALKWAASEGGVAGLVQRSEENLKVLSDFVNSHTWIHFLAKDISFRSSTSVCLTLDLEPAQVKALIKLLSSEKVAFDIGSYRDAPAGLRIWCGATVEKSDLEKLLPWLEWAYHQVLVQ